ncbi:helix-turn-helix transcriptional regulator [Streptomyces sp. NPDC006514]|uniref:helix-turn-helix domain-containing protein n=1 Tax=Streptomyces sp. NPDC006514 TaxID=3154308 RepID=UPI0033B16BF9
MAPAERARLREAAGVTQARLAAALKSTPQTVKNWESGRSEPRPPRLQAYLRLLDGWTAGPSGTPRRPHPSPRRNPRPLRLRFRSHSPAPRSSPPGPPRPPPPRHRIRS